MVADVQEVPGVPASGHRRPTARASVVPQRLGHLPARCKHQRDLLEPQQH